MTEKDYKRALKDKLIQYRNILNISSDITFGIEIEYENIKYDDFSTILSEEKLYDLSLKDWQNKHEPDISEYNNNFEEYNGEVISPVLTDNSISWNALEAILYLLDRNDAIITNKCGGHVNIGSQILEDNINYYKNFLLLYILYRNEIKEFCKGQYINIRPSFYIKSIYEEYLIKNIICAKRIKDFDFILFDKDHELCINENGCSEFEFGNVIEFRLPNGTLDPAIWQNYINFFTKFLIACKKELDYDNIVYNINNNKATMLDLASFTFTDDLDKENFLIQSFKTNNIYKKELCIHKSYMTNV